MTVSAHSIACLDCSTSVWTQVSHQNSELPLLEVAESWLSQNKYEAEDYIFFCEPEEEPAWDECMVFAWNNQSERYAVYQPLVAGFAPCLFHNFRTKEEANAIICLFSTLSEFTTPVGEE